MSRFLSHTMKIGTHSGHFHADEALAVWMLRQTKEFAGAEVVRSRDLAVLDQCDIVVDVGGKYEAPKWLDHHQREFTTTFDEKHTTTRLSSAGLVYKHFGKEVVASILERVINAANAANAAKTEESKTEESKKRKLDLGETRNLGETVDAVYAEAYDSFVEAVDALDNGVNAHDSPPKYRTNGVTLQAVVGNLSPVGIEDGSDAAIDAQFQKASEFMGMAFEAEIRSLGLGWFPSKEAVRAAFQARFEHDQAGRIVVLSAPAFWKEFIEEFEAEARAQGEEKAEVLYVLYPTSDSVRIQAVSKSLGSFESRKALPAPWRGVRDDQLAEVAGVPGAVFVHASGFIGGNRTLEGALQMAKVAVDFE